MTDEFTDQFIDYGKFIIVQKFGGEHTRIMKVTKKQRILIEKLKINADSLVGKPYGLFEVASGNASTMKAEQLLAEQEEQESVLMDNGRSQKDGQETSSDEPKVEVIAPSAVVLGPEQTRQVLTQENVHEMKEQGTTGKDLVAKLVEGSATFQTRTVHSQSKYIKRKSKKHCDRVLVLKPTLRLLASAYYTKEADRIANLRLDQLGLLLQQAGVHAGKRVVVFEQVAGLLTAAVLERLGGQGHCVHLHRGTVAQSIPCVHSMNFGEKVMSTFYPVRIACAIAGKQLPYSNRPGNGIQAQESEKSTEGEVDTDNNEEVDSEEAEVIKRRAERIGRELKGLDLLHNQAADALLIGSRTVDPVSVLELVYPKLRAASTIAIYGPHFKPMVEAYEWLLRNNAIHMQLTDQMNRVHQVLPGRSHPLMSQFVVGGYVLSAIKTFQPPTSLTTVQQTSL